MAVTAFERDVSSPLGTTWSYFYFWNLSPHSHFKASVYFLIPLESFLIFSLLLIYSYIHCQVYILWGL